MPIRPSKRPSEITKQRAKQLRIDATLPETKLWSLVRGRRLGGLKFRRQHPIEPFIVDFYCAAVGVVIELDGRSHDEQIDYDEQRTNHLNELGLHVLRISNDDVLTNLEGVCQLIHSTALTLSENPKQPR